MKWMMIENTGECDVRAFTMLGVSSARGCSDSIGQFGSGAKHGILVCLRAGLRPVVYSGLTKLEFSTRSAAMGETAYNEVLVSIDGRKPTALSWSLEFGSLDWGDDLAMAMREFISNAIDAGCPVVEETAKPRAKRGTTRVFVEATPTIRTYVLRLPERFLQWSPNYDASKVILEKRESGSAKIHRKGVFVRQLADVRNNSLFDYNFGDELEIDESRNLSDYKVSDAVGRAIVEDREACKTVVAALLNGSNAYETSLTRWDLTSNETGWRDNLRSAWPTGALIASSSIIADLARRRGYTCHVVEHDGWRDRLISVGISDAIEHLGEYESKGMIVSEPTSAAIANRDACWEWLRELELTNNRPKPEVKCFSRTMECESDLNGFCDSERGYVAISKDYDGNRQVMLEELAHWVTGSTDNSRDFQDFAFRLATRACKVIFE